MGLTRILCKRSWRMIYFTSTPGSNYMIYKFVRYFHNHEIFRFPRALSVSRISRINSENIKEKEFPNDKFEFLEKDTDVFGIESDDGAIYFNKEAAELEKFKDLFAPEKRYDEVIHEASFGQIRRDIDNPPRHLRSFRNNSSSSAETAVHPADENFSNTKFEGERTERKLDPKKSPEYSFITNSQNQSNVNQSSLFISPVDHNVEENVNTESLYSDEKSITSSYLDEQCFNTRYSDTVSDANEIATGSESFIKENHDGHATIIDSTKSSDSIEGITQANDLNYVDQCYFSSDNYNDQLNNLQLRHQSSENQTLKTDKLHEGFSSSLHLDNNFIDTCYFNNLQEENKSVNDSVLGQVNDEQFNYSQQGSKILPTSVNQEFEDVALSQTSIRQEKFSNSSDLDHNSFNNKCYLNNLQEKDKCINNSVMGQINEQVNYLQQGSDVLKTNINQEVKDNDLSKTSIQLENLSATTTIVEQKTSKNDKLANCYLQQEDDSKETNKYTKFNFKFGMKQYLHDNNSSFSSGLKRKNVKPLSVAENLLQHVEKLPLEDVNNIKELKDVLNEPLISETNKQLSEVEDEESDEQVKSKTAIDYVLKLKRATKVRTEILKDGDLTKLTGEKFDSKGFRILKNQVPELSKLTHEELLTVLKHRIVYQNDDLLVLNKPYNLVIHDAKSNREPSLSNFLDDLAHHFDKKSSSPKLYTVHRLDKETTGCLLLARNEMVAEYLKSLFAQQKITKMYWIVTSKVPDPVEGIIDIPITEGKIGDKVRMVLSPIISKEIPYKSHAKRGKRAVTHYKVISTSGNAALVEVRPETGLKHQIRVHFSFGLGCPIIGDHKYSHLDKFAPQKLSSDLLQRLHVRQSKVRYIPMHIHARAIIIPGLLEGRNIVAYSPLPEHMAANLRRLKFRKK